MKDALRFASLGSITTLFVAVASADPTEDAKALLQDFLNQPNYTWSAPQSRGMPEESRGTTAEAVSGQHEMGGYTKAWFVTGPHIPPDDWPSTKPWPGITDEDKFFSSRWVFENDEGWRLLTEIPPPVPIAPRPVSTGPVTTTTTLPPPAGVKGAGPVTRHTTTYPAAGTPIFEARTGIYFRWFGFWRPDREIAIVAENVASVEKLGANEYRVELTPEGAAKLANPPVPTALKLTSLVAWRIDNPSASAKLVVRDGALTDYELSIEGTLISFGMNRRSVAYTKKRSLTHLGTTVIDVPPVVVQKLGR